ncbi:MAG: DUF5723 family protein, partial [Bacteroidota bacterium]
KLVILFCFVALSSSGQDFFISENSDKKHELKISSEFNFASNAFTYELAKEYYLKGFITNEMKDGVSKNLDLSNRAGGQFISEIRFSHQPQSMFGSTNWSWNITARNINHVNSNFSKDLFEVFFRGNKNYAGKTADFSDFNFLYLKFQQLSFGLSKKFGSDSCRMEVGAALGLNVGQEMQKITTGSVQLFTEEFGSFIDVNADLEMRTSDSLKKKFGSANGIGLSTDLFYKVSIQEKHHFLFKINNLGFIRWNDRTTDIKADTSFRFEGIDINDLFELQDTITTTATNDSSIVQDFLSNRSFKRYTLILPARFEILYRRPIGHRNLHGETGLNYVLNADYKLQYRVAADYAWATSVAGLSLSVGGYTDFGVGAFYLHQFKKGFTFRIGSNYLNSFFDLNKSRAQQLFLSLSRNF